MSKVTFTKLGLTKNQNVDRINFNDQEIEIKQYLPVNEKLELISNVINLSSDDNNFANPIKINIFTVLEMLYAYTNINFTEKQKEDPAKLYDLVVGSGLAKNIISRIPHDEYYEITSGVKDSVAAVYKYRNSALGILESISTDYSNLNLDAAEIQKKIADPENITLLKEVVSKLG